MGIKEKKLDKGRTMRFTIYILREKELDYDYGEWVNVRTTIYLQEARVWRDSSNPWAFMRSFDMMELEIPDDMVWGK